MGEDLQQTPSGDIAESAGDPFKKSRECRGVLGVPVQRPMLTLISTNHGGSRPRTLNPVMNTQSVVNWLQRLVRSVVWFRSNS